MYFCNIVVNVVFCYLLSSRWLGWFSDKL